MHAVIAIRHRDSACSCKWMTIAVLSHVREPEIRGHGFRHEGVVMRYSRFTIEFEEARVAALFLHSPTRLRAFESVLVRLAAVRHSRVVNRGFSRDIKRFNKVTNLLTSVRSALSDGGEQQLTFF